jgi:hypothetical protein
MPLTYSCYSRRKGHAISSKSIRVFEWEVLNQPELGPLPSIYRPTPTSVDEVKLLDGWCKKYTYLATDSSFLRFLTQLDYPGSSPADYHEHGAASPQHFLNAPYMYTCWNRNIAILLQTRFIL